MPDPTPIVELLSEGIEKYNSIGIEGILGAIILIWIVSLILNMRKDLEK